MIRVYFDDEEISPDYIRSLTQSSQIFDKEFFLGATVCRTFELSIDNRANFTLPTNVILYEDNGSDEEEDWTKYATLLIDSVNQEDEMYTDLSLTDVMVRFNKVFVYNFGYTVKELLEQICTSNGIELETQEFYLDLLEINWNGKEEITQREFISYVAEVNAGYAYIDANGNLCFAQFSSIPKNIVRVDQCSSFKLGEHHIIDRVCLELGTASIIYPTSGDTNETIYLNPENILFTDEALFGMRLKDEDGNKITTQDEEYIMALKETSMYEIVNNIYNYINGFEFYNIEVEKCPISGTVNPGECISFVDSENNYFKTIANVEFSYQSKWIGGYKLAIDNVIQQETKILNSANSLKQLNIKVDRQNGVIEQRISNSEGYISLLQQTAEDIQMNFVDTRYNEYWGNLITNIVFDAQGINISSNNVDTNLQLSSEGVFIRANNSQTNLATMEVNQFTMGEWVMARTGNSLNIFKRH